MDGPDDGFPKFGEGFDGFPKRLPNDCIEYSLFIIDAKIKNNRERLAKLETVRKESIKVTSSLLRGYIWQRDSFQLTVENHDGQMYLHGLTNYGDSVEDEWLIVYVLRELSSRFPELWIRVVDTDGEFLLIEAANALPRWLNPEIADNRVWINDNKLKIIPLANEGLAHSKTSITNAHSLTTNDALNTIISNRHVVFNSPLIEEEAFYRLKSYPSQISNSLHHARATIPRKLAHILHQLPASIAPAVEAFYLRDPISLKALQVPLSAQSFPPVDLVNISIKFTKVLFAQLKAQQFPPPQNWKEFFADLDTSDEDIKKAAQLELGMKVTSGFEMLVTDQKNKDDKRVREINILLDDLASENDILPSDAEMSSWTDIKREDDEKWLDINYEDFENELAGKGKKDDKSRAVPPGAFGPESPPGFGDPKTQSDLKKMVERFEAFLNDDEAGFDGAEIDDMDMDDDDDDSDEDSDDDEDEDREVSFDEEEFARMMREMMGMPTAEEEAGLGLSSRGKKKVESIDSEDEESEDEESEIRKVMEKMEAELNEAGALNLDPTPSKLAALKGQNRKGTESPSSKQQDEESDDEDEDDEVDIDFNLAKNLLESFKSQGGMSGPAGNMLAAMGIQLPRDADDERQN